MISTAKKAAIIHDWMECWFPPGGVMSRGALLKDPTIQKIAKAHGKSAAQIILHWHIQEGFSVIPGATNPEMSRDHPTDKYYLHNRQIRYGRIESI